MKYIIIIFITVLFLSIASLGQAQIKMDTKEDSITQLITLMREDGRVTTPGVGFRGSPSDQYFRFLSLLLIADIETFIKLTNETTLCLKIYGYMGVLFKAPTNKPKELKRLLLKDNSSIATVEGCVDHSSTVHNAIRDISKWYSEKWIAWDLREYDHHKLFKQAFDKM